MPEDEDPPETNSRQRQFVMTENHRANTGLPFIDSTQDAQSTPTRSRSQRDSMYTDIDDGSFIEFCHGKEKGHRVSRHQIDPTRKMPLLYYTCESSNNTQYSTSTKTNNALVGFHKYLDKLKMERYQKNALEESEAEGVEVQNQLDMYNETIITCSADIRRFFPKGPAADAINSTVIDKPPHQVKVTAPCMFPDISTLTIHPEAVTGSDSQPQLNHPTQRCKAYQQTVILSESSDEGESCPSEGNCGVKVISVYSKIREPPKSVGDADMRGECLSLVSEDISIISNGVAVPQRNPSVVSEDVSVISKTESHVSVPQKSSTVEILRSAASPRGGSPLPMVCGGNNEDERKRDNSYHIIPVMDGNEQMLGQTKPTVHKWVMTSPFKESSFDSSFLQRKQDSYISESPSQPRLCYNHEAVEPNTRKSEDKHLDNFGNIQQGKCSQTVSTNCGTSHADPVIKSTSYYESSECELSLNQKTAKEKVIVSSSDELEDNKRNGMFVTQRRKKHSKNLSGSFKVTCIETSDDEESFHLRLTRGSDEASSASGKDIHTIGRVATSPDSKVNSPSKVLTQTLPHLKNSYPKSREKCDSDGFIRRENPPNNSPCLDRLLPDNKVNLSDSIESLTTSLSKSASPQNCADSDGSLDLSLIKKELDNLYSSEWRKNEDAIFKTVIAEKKQRRNIISKKAVKDRRRSRSWPEANLGTDEGEEREAGHVCQAGETSGDRDTMKTTSGEEMNGSSEHSRSGVRNKDEKVAKTSIIPCGSPEDDSFEEYLKKVKSTQKKQPRQKIDISSEDENKYESSFINDESDDENYILPQVPLNPYMSPPDIQGSVKSKVSTPKIQERGRQRERHHSNDDIIPVYSNGNGKTAKSAPMSLSSPEEDSFEEYLRKARSLPRKGKQQQRIQCSSEDESSYESSFINDDSDDESYSLPKVNQKLIRNSPEDPKSIPQNKGKVTIRPNSDVKINTWRSTPTVNLMSDSDSSESDCFIEKIKKTTPHQKRRVKVLPQTEGHHQQRDKKYNTNQVSPRLSFLASLSSNVNIIQCHPEALPYVKNFKKRKEELAEKLYRFYNTHVFDSKLPSSMNINWNARLTKTAGYCYYQIIGSGNTGRGSRIDLSTKVSILI